MSLPDDVHEEEHARLHQTNEIPLSKVERDKILALCLDALERAATIKRRPKILYWDKDDCRGFTIGKEECELLRSIIDKMIYGR